MAPITDLKAEKSMESRIPSNADMRRTWDAMRKFCRDESLTDQEWRDLSQLTLIDHDHLEFGPGNCRWAITEAERADNLAFYKSLGASCRDAPVIH
jgi:hypothetical protein